MKRFFTEFNGISITWSMELAEKNVGVGAIKVRRLQEIEKITVNEDTLEICSNWNDLSAKTIDVPNLKSSAFFCLEQNDWGHVLLVYHNPVASIKDFDSSDENQSNVNRGESSSYLETPSIWFADRCGRIHYICNNFSAYMRLLVTHLGIRGWQSAFIPEGLSPQTRLIMNIFCKERLVTDLCFREKYSG